MHSSRPTRLPLNTAFLFFLSLLILLLGSVSARAVEPVEVSRGDLAIDLTGSVEIYRDQGNAFQISTVPDSNGIRRRIEVRSTNSNGTGDWAVFSLANISDEQLDRLIVAPHFRLPNSGVFWPDLGSTRIEAITPSEGFALSRQSSSDADVFSITLNPGAVITFVAELDSPDLPQLYLWQPDAYKDTENAFTLYHGVVLGIAGLLAVFLTILFVVKGTSLLPATAMLAWSVLLYVSIDFGFLHMLIPLSPTDERIWRASADVAIAFSFVIFLFTYLSLSRWHVHLSYATAVWGVILMALFSVAIFDPPAAAGIARISGAGTVIAGVVLIIYLSIRRYDRAILLMPAWALITAWLFAAYLTVTGRIDNDIVQPALNGGLVLIVLLLGFTVIQHAFSTGGHQTGLLSDLERQALALLGSDGVVWDWDVSRDRIITEPDFSRKLGLENGALTGAARNWLQYLHPGDRDRFRSTLDLFLEWKRGRLKLEFRIRADDGHYHWMLIKARPVLSTDGEVIRCVGTLCDMTDQKVSTQRLLQDAVTDNLTGLPNRTIFIDRLQSLIPLAITASELKPTLIIADIDRYADINETLGFAAGDNILIALTRRIQRLLKPEDTLSRISGNRFAIILLSQTTPDDIAEFTEALTAAIAVPISFDNREIMLTASIGIASWHDEQETADELVEDAQLAMSRAKRAGGNTVETYRPAFRMLGDEQQQIEADLARAIDRKEMSVIYRPIVRLESHTVTGFHSQLNWRHPQRGEISAAEVLAMSQENGTTSELVLHMVRQALSDLATWQSALPKAKPFITVDLVCSEMLRTSTLIELENIIRQSGIAPRQIVFSIPETVFLQAPEQSRLAMQHLRSIGTGLAVSGFGNAYGSLSLINHSRFDIVYIDAALFRQHQDVQSELMAAFTTLSEIFGLDVGVTNVTSEAEAPNLLQAGCRYASGSLYGASSTAANVPRILRDAAGPTA